ncbi:spore germination protein [Clostridium aceticum]|uniref:Spore germination protein n=1 Tax=Clostridium aceticum TaxID=84022 RepID=A0A0D8IDU8_9CLOT|nr:Ger(x)C family spore germination protein [Clostridium aceticum]AKL96476.1 spore germination protein [Clostridium aceticum]KJF27351.1 hypothetical protein TZ02_08425 [Clostridium aceticum]
MKNTKKGIVVTLLCISMLIQTGCWDQKIYERIGFILQIGLELDQDENLIYTISIPIVSPDVEAKVDVFSTPINTLREGREEVLHVSGKSVEGGKIQHLFFSKQLAQKETMNFFDVFLRSSENSLLPNVIVVDGSPQEMMELSSKFPSKPRPSYYVNTLLENARRNFYVPETRIYNFLSSVYSNTIDPITPLLRYNDHEIEVAGSALFKGDKMVGEITTTETGLLHALMGTDGRIRYKYYQQEKQRGIEVAKEGTIVLIKDIKRKLNIDIQDIPKIDIKLDLTASIDEYTDGYNLSDPEEKKRLEAAIAKSIEEDCLILLKYLQEVGSDPLGIGEMIRSKHNWYWNSVEWEEVYRKVDFGVDVKLKVEFFGAIY